MQSNDSKIYTMHFSSAICLFCYRWWPPIVERKARVATPQRFWVQYVARGLTLHENVAKASKKYHYTLTICKVWIEPLRDKHNVYGEFDNVLRQGVTGYKCVHISAKWEKFKKKIWNLKAENWPFSNPKGREDHILVSPLFGLPI